MIVYFLSLIIDDLCLVFIFIVCDVSILWVMCKMYFMHLYVIASIREGIHVIYLASLAKTIFINLYNSVQMLSFDSKAQLEDFGLITKFLNWKMLYSKIVMPYMPTFIFIYTEE